MRCLKCKEIAKVCLENGWMHFKCKRHRLIEQERAEEARALAAFGRLEVTGNEYKEALERKLVEGDYNANFDAYWWDYDTNRHLSGNY